MGLFDLLFGSDSKTKKNRYDEGYLDGVEGYDWNYKKMKDKSYEEGFLDALNDEEEEEE